MRANLNASHPHRRGLIARAAAVPVIAALAVAGCGGTSTSKPSYCTARSNLEQSIKALPQTDVLKNGTKALEASVQKVVNNANALVDAAKSDFPNETGAIKTSVDTLSKTLGDIERSGPTAASIAAVPGEVSAAVTAVDKFMSATTSKCS